MPKLVINVVKRSELPYKVVTTKQLNQDTSPWRELFDRGIISNKNGDYCLHEQSLIIGVSDDSGQLAHTSHVDYIQLQQPYLFSDGFIKLVFAACGKYKLTSFSIAIQDSESLASFVSILHELNTPSFTLKSNPDTFALERVDIISDIEIKEQDIANYAFAGQARRYASNLADMPANLCTVDYIAQEAQRLYPASQLKILDAQMLTQLNMQALLSVSQGSIQSPKVIIVEHLTAGENAPTLALVGKGVVYDTGGLDIKLNSMADMKKDMMGAASVMAVMRIIAQYQLKLNIVGLVGLVENSVGSKATHPGDIIKSMSGKSIEIKNTDAEGRLVLADLITYAQNFYKPKTVVTVATLTGGICVALGKYMSGVFSNKEDLLANFLKASVQAKENFWPMPMPYLAKESNKSHLADLSNLPDRSAGGGHIGAAWFLQEFINQNVGFLHLDVARAARQWTDEPYLCNEIGIATLMQFFASHCS